MNCLYGDSTPSPLREGFLTLLPALVDTLVELLLLHELSQEQDLQVEAITEEAQALQDRFTDLSDDMRTILSHLDHETSPAHLSDQPKLLSADLLETIERHQDEIDRRRDELIGELQDAQVGTRERLEPLVKELFIYHEFPETEWHVQWRYSKDALPPVAAEGRMRHHMGWAGTFGLRPPGTGLWADAVRVANVVEDLAVVLPQKALLGDGLKKNRVRLTPFYVVHVDASNELRRVILSKGPGGRGPAYQFEELVEHGQVSVILDPDEEGGGGALALNGEDRDAIRAFLSQVSRDVMPLSERRVDLTAFTLKGVPLRQIEDVPTVVRSLVAAVGPYLDEVVRRSPDPRELTLKRAVDEHRREELFLPLSEIVSPIRGLGGELRTFFAPWGLEGTSDFFDDEDLTQRNKRPAIQRDVTATPPPVFLSISEIQDEDHDEEVTHGRQVLNELPADDLESPEG